ncbi:hypothetical protein GCM10009861_02170 [Neomicrococcus aestuarii]
MGGVITICPHCSNPHPTTTSARVAGSYFVKPYKFAAKYDGAPLRDTRQEAELDYCKWRNRDPK